MTTTPVKPPDTSSLADDVRAIRELPAPAERRRIRGAARLSLAQMGRYIGVTSTRVWQLERDAKPLPHTDNTVRYARLIADLLRQFPPSSAAQT